MCIESLVHELYLKDILITELQVLSGFSLEQLCELFKAGCTLTPPKNVSLSDCIEEIERNK